MVSICLPLAWAVAPHGDGLILYGAVLKTKDYYMSKKIYVDAAHPEEMRVVVIESDSNRISDFDVETTTKPQIKGNIYLAKVIRVEPSLQAAFVDYGAGKNGFLPFSEIHPDYYQVNPEQNKKLL